MRDKQYFDETEAECDTMLQQFNADLGVFEQIGRFSVGSVIDVSAMTTTGKKCLIELKMRKNSPFKYDDVFIESKKIAYLLLMKVTEGYEPLYINGFQEGKYIAVWRLNKVTDFKYYPSVPIHSNGYGTDKREERFGLKMDDAALFERIDGKYYEIVKRRGERI